jgi:elongation factor 1 alpha-like protein
MVMFHSQCLSEPTVVSKLVSILNKNSGEVIQKHPRCLTKQMNAIIELKFHRPVCLELYRENKVLGRFMLRYSGKTIAAGMISEIK